MSKANKTARGRLIWAGAVAAAVMLLMACSVNVKKDDQGEDKKVDIETPIGGIHVGKDVGAEDAGLAVYPGARRVDKSNDHDENANVTLSFGGYGLKVVAVRYESDDPKEKVISFYKDQMKKYGNVLECHTRQHGGDVNMHSGDKDKDSNGLHCEDDGGDVLELKVGTQKNQRIVAIEPKSGVTSFALVHVQMRGGDTI